jgi:hypothetical protein
VGWVQAQFLVPVSGSDLDLVLDGELVLEPGLEFEERACPG